MKGVFVGSSTAAIRHAKAVCKLLKSQGVMPLPWWEQFPPGSVTLEAIEDVIQRCCGAVLLASPDDVRITGETSQHVSRDNVILELGMFSARLGRRNVALLRFDDVTLPTDLSGFTHVKMGPFDAARDVRSVGEPARTHLLNWVDGLQDLAEGVSRTCVLHGYSGRWHLDVRFSRWWDVEVVDPDYVTLDGYADLIIPSSGSGGLGVAFSSITAFRTEPRSTVVVKTIQTLDQVACNSSGKLSVVNSVFSREMVEATGEPPAGGGFQQKAEGPVRYTTEASPVKGDVRVLQGFTRLSVGNRDLTYGELVMNKL